ncbi:MAG: ATP-binding protein [Gemmataceae bacterium]
MLGEVDWDDGSATNETVLVRIPFSGRGKLMRNRLVRIEDREGGKAFLGRVSEGPFFKAKSTESDLPAFALARVEIQGELRGNLPGETSTRPAPGSILLPLEDEAITELVGCTGDMVLGRLIGHDNVPLCLQSQHKAVLPRNLGIFGTVGSGKSNTCQVLIEEASKAGWAVVVVDVEGEYTCMDQPSDEADSVKQLALVGRFPHGLGDLTVYHPASCPGERKDGKPFTLRLADFLGPVIGEVLDATPAERNALFDCIDHFQSRNRQRLAVNEREELAGLLDTSSSTKLPFNVFALRERCVERSSRSNTDLDFVGLGVKLLRLMHTQVFDEPSFPSLDITKLLAPGRVSVLDVSAANQVLQNLVTADILRKSFACKMLRPEAPPTLLVIEEAHAFISKDRVASMSATLDMLRTVTRRGRKRWLSVAFVTQQPGHLPPEVFELCNTRLVHNLRSLHNLQALMATAGDVSQAMWGRCPLLAPGEALVSSPQLRRPMLARIRPSATQRRFTH